MTNFSEALGELIKFAGAMSILSGAMAWYGKNSPKEDKVIAEAATFVLDVLSDADKVSKTDLHTGKNLRDQMTLEEAQELHREREFYSWPNRN